MIKSYIQVKLKLLNWLFYWFSTLTTFMLGELNRLAFRVGITYDLTVFMSSISSSCMCHPSGKIPFSLRDSCCSTSSDKHVSWRSLENLLTFFFGERCFWVSCANLCKSLLDDLRCSVSLDIFKSELKTYLFNLSTLRVWKKRLLHSQLSISDVIRKTYKITMWKLTEGKLRYLCFPKITFYHIFMEPRLL